MFCQNHDSSWQVQGEPVTPARLAEMLLALQARGGHNRNWVTPSTSFPSSWRPSPLAVAGGLGLPMVYNTSADDSLDSLELLEGVVDVYLPDGKVWSPQAARRYLRRPDDGAVARAAVKEMARQVGPLVVDADGLARRGLLVRHLVMPGMLAETEAVLRFVAGELGPDTSVDLMAQYDPAGLVGKDGRDGDRESTGAWTGRSICGRSTSATAWGCGWMCAAWPARPGWHPPTPRPDPAARCRTPVERSGASEQSSAQRFPVVP